MKKIIDDPKNFVDEMIEGILTAHLELRQQKKCFLNMEDQYGIAKNH